MPFTITIMDHLGPRLSDYTVSPRSASLNQPVQILTYAYDISGITSIQAVIRPYPSGEEIAVPLADDGQHQDNAAGDGLHGGIYIPTGAAMDFIVDLVSQDSAGNIRSYAEAGAFTTVPLEVTDILIVNSSPDLEADNRIRDVLTAMNIGHASWEETIPRIDRWDVAGDVSG